MSFKTALQDHLPKNHISGNVCIETTQISFVGKDVSYGFGKRFQLLNGEFLKISPHDLIYRVMTCTTDSNGIEKHRYTCLPSSLFSQARIETPNGDAICYTELPENDKDGSPKCYLLDLAPSRTLQGSLRPFDDLAGWLEHRSKVSGILFHDREDIPDDYFIIERDNMCYSLSPETKSIEIGTGKVLPLNFDKLNYETCEIPPDDTHYDKASCIEPLVMEILDDENKPTGKFLPFDLDEPSVKPCQRYSVYPIQFMDATEDEKCITIRLGAPGLPRVEFLFDRNHLYVTIEDKIFKNSIYFWESAIEKEPEMIDVDHISASFLEDGLLQITIPFFQDGNHRLQETSAPILSHSLETVALPTEITVQYPAQLGEHLYIRGEGSGFTWDQKIPLVNVDGNTWKLSQPMQGDFRFKILLNNEEWETGGDHLAKGGDAVAAAPVFASQAEKSSEGSPLTRVSFFYQPADGETLEVRDSLHDWNAGIELKSMGNGMWVWETDKAASEFDFKLVRKDSNGEVHWEGGDNRKMQPGTIALIEPRF